jgi:hypothetical protein
MDNIKSIKKSMTCSRRRRICRCGCGCCGRSARNGGFVVYWSGIAMDKFARSQKALKIP